MTCEEVESFVCCKSKKPRKFHPMTTYFKHIELKYDLMVKHFLEDDCLHVPLAGDGCSKPMGARVGWDKIHDWERRHKTGKYTLT